jgi:p24 family protein beta-1
LVLCIPLPDMFFASAAKLLVAAGLFHSALAHNINLPAHGRECFHETLKKDDRMTVTFQVGDREFGSSGNLEIDFWVRQAIPGSPPRRKSHD